MCLMPGGIGAASTTIYKPRRVPNSVGISIYTIHSTQLGTSSQYREAAEGYVESLAAPQVTQWWGDI